MKSCVFLNYWGHVIRLPLNVYVCVYMFVFRSVFLSSFPRMSLLLPLSVFVCDLRCASLSLSLSPSHSLFHSPNSKGRYTCRSRGVALSVFVCVCLTLSLCSLDVFINIICK